MRGFLAEDYGVDLDSVKWVTFEDPHVARIQGPAIRRARAGGQDLKQMLLDGEIDAAILGDKLPDPRLQAPDSRHAEAAHAWAASTAACRSTTWRSCATHRQSRPDVVREIFRLLQESSAAAELPTEGRRRIRSFRHRGEPQVAGEIIDIASSRS